MKMLESKIKFRIFHPAWFTRFKNCSFLCTYVIYFFHQHD